MYFLKGKDGISVSFLELSEEDIVSRRRVRVKKKTDLIKVFRSVRGRVVLFKWMIKYNVMLINKMFRIVI